MDRLQKRQADVTPDEIVALSTSAFLILSNKQNPGNKKFGSK